MEFGVVWLIRAGWLASILLISIASIPTSKLSKYRGFVVGFAGRGKTLQSSSQKFTVPQKFFVHFYVLGVAWTTLLLVTAWTYAYKKLPLTGGGSHAFWRAVFLLLLMEGQVTRRLVESVYVFKYSPSARMHIFGYLTGLFFYTAAPLSLSANIVPELARFAGNQVAEFIGKGKSHTSAPEFDLWLSVNTLMKLGWLQWIGAAVFVWGWLHQRSCHSILGSLRKRPDQGSEYVIPRGDWFEIVSSPHYLAEIVLYSGIVIASGGTDVNVWLVFGFVVANLTIAAGETHRWYHRKFDNYPKERRAIFPFVY